MLTIDRLYRINNDQVWLRTFGSRQDVFDVCRMEDREIVCTKSYRLHARSLLSLRRLSRRRSIGIVLCIPYTSHVALRVRSDSSIKQSFPPTHNLIGLFFSGEILDLYIVVCKQVLQYLENNSRFSDPWLSSE